MAGGRPGLLRWWCPLPTRILIYCFLQQNMERGVTPEFSPVLLGFHLITEITSSTGEYVICSCGSEHLC